MSDRFETAHRAIPECDPGYGAWLPLAEGVARSSQLWRTSVAGIPLVDIRQNARAEVLAAATAFTERIGVALPAPADADAPSRLLAVTGHQPALFHPGVWVKNFLIDRFARESGATALNLVVDSDSFDTVSLSSPCVTERSIVRCTAKLASGSHGLCFAWSPPPTSAQIDSFAEEAHAFLGTLPRSDARHNFERYVAQLRQANDAVNLGEFLTFARRRYEAEAETAYLELPVSHLTQSDSFARFAAGIISEISRFAHVHNEALA
ncbi:MAG: hypothetical protein U1E29_11815, partial [Coriobacteriia bacterium]|nr:hypothetical protein [Coriobacteriia bacterium]